MSFEPVPEAELRDGAPVGEGWFVVNVADARTRESPRFGASARFEGQGAARFPEFGINVRVIQPGQPASLYHRENAQEAFLVLIGECLLIVEDQERRLRKGDFVHLPAGTAHVLVGAGSEPASVIMVGTRADPKELLYAVSESAARYGASAERETADAAEAYGRNDLSDSHLGLPW